MGSIYLRQGQLRLDGRFYAEDAWIARLLAQETSDKQVTLGGDDGLADVWMPARFKRVEVSDPDLGVPFVTPSEIVQARRSLGRYISRARTRDLERYIVDEGWVLVSRSGTVGRAVMTSGTLRGVAVSEDAIRVIAREGALPGYLYAYLACFVGYSLVCRDQYGAVVKHIEPSHLAQIPVPLLPLPLQRRISDDIVRAYRLRDEANERLDEAENMLHQELHLPRITATAHLYGGSDVKAFAVRSGELDLRLDGSHYDTPGRHAVRTLEAREDVRYLRDVTERIFHPFRMNMVLVEKGHGVPFLGGSDIIEFRYFGDKYISPITENYEAYLLRRGWVLMTIGGTTGRVAYVGPQIHGWAASQHVTRIVARQTEVQPGYLYAFLASDYGRLQVDNLVYGAVVDTIRESQLETLRVPVPPRAAQERIHEKVEAAYKNRAEANQLEDQATRLFEDTLVKAYQKRTGRMVALRQG
jgi:type I restriction enzyme S subunit